MQSPNTGRNAWWSMALSLAARLLAFNTASSWGSFVIGTLLLVGWFRLLRGSEGAESLEKWARRLGSGFAIAAAPFVVLATPPLYWVVLNQVLDPNYVVVLEARDLSGEAPTKRALTETVEKLSQRFRASEIPHDIIVVRIGSSKGLSWPEARWDGARGDEAEQGKTRRGARPGRESAPSERRELRVW
ncbi:MAG: hypothetical protein OXU33_01300 [Gemmatimonadota bacterium]|nr:hypothetical protein [Gemmatimonadota bacterium]MDE3005506.1 hypothetical protein [Gemmatimonadota bacterium]MDE3012696.1 hypothetical protein [Gemmatimonadota bacterium]